MCTQLVAVTVLGHIFTNNYLTSWQDCSEIRIQYNLLLIRNVVFYYVQFVTKIVNININQSITIA